MKIMFTNALLSLILITLADAEVSKPPPFMNSFITPEPTTSPAPTILPTFRPSVSSIPSNQPSSSPSMSPTSSPSISSMPTIEKSYEPSIILSSAPSTNPTSTPSKVPTTLPTLSPSMQHSVAPSPLPSSAPSSEPSGSPVISPSSIPTVTASATPSKSPEESPSSSPTSYPTVDPSFAPIESPSVGPTSNPAVSPSSSPEGSPSAAPTETSQPSVRPSLAHSKSPSSDPSLKPSEVPSGSPEGSPSTQPFSQPSIQPSSQPSPKPSNQPSSQPSSKPSNQPSSQPTLQPSTFPSARPTSTPTTPRPTSNPSYVPTSTPSAKPSISPTLSPSISPSRLPSGNPTSTPTLNPSEFPSDLPSLKPSNQPTSLPTSFPSENPTEVHVEAYNTTLVIGFKNFNVAMDDSHKGGFENYLKNFITLYMEKPDRVDVQVDSVNVVSQYRQLDVQDGLQNRSRLLRGKDNENDSMGITRELEKVGLLVEVQVLTTITYGAALSADFSVANILSQAIENNFQTFMDQNHKNTVNGAWGPPLFDESEPIPQKTNYLLIISLAVGCSVGGMILGTAVLLLFSRRRDSTAIGEYQHQSNPSNPYGGLGAGPRIVLQESDDFLNTNQSSSIFTNPNALDEEFGKSRSSTWDWRDPDSRPSQSDDRGNENSEDDESDRSSAYELEGQRELANMYSSASSTNIDTPSGSASTCTGQGSLGINLSPEALYEAQKQQQQFTFVPRETNASLGMVYPESALAHGNSNRDQHRTGRLVYKSLVCYAPPGPLGVIIDTTAEGPMVHSIKPTSQLLGSMAPGDVVVGLDNIETRQMTAPALTRLMARKSQQPKRKITLLRPVMT